MKKSVFVQTILLIFILLQTDCGKKSTENEMKGLELSIHCPDRNILVGDEIPVVFTITNRREHNYRYDIPNYDRSGRMWEYKLQAKDKKGNIATDPRENVEFGIGGG